MRSISQSRMRRYFGVAGAAAGAAAAAVVSALGKVVAIRGAGIIRRLCRLLRSSPAL